MNPDLSRAFTVREKQVEGVWILRLERNLKGVGEAALKERIDGLVRAGQIDIVIDLESMPHIDSTELGRLIRAHISVRNAGGRVKLCNLAPRVVTLMKMTKLDTVLDIYHTEEEALAGMRTRHGV